MKGRIVPTALVSWISVFALAPMAVVRAGAADSADRPQRGDSAAFPVTIKVDAALSIGEMRPVWRFFGYDEPNYTYMKDGVKLLSQLSSLGPHTVFIRAHNLLTSGDGRPAL